MKKEDISFTKILEIPLVRKVYSGGCQISVKNRLKTGILEEIGREDILDLEELTIEEDC